MNIQILLLRDMMLKLRFQRNIFLVVLTGLYSVLHGLCINRQVLQMIKMKEELEKMHAAAAEPDDREVVSFGPDDSDPGK